MIIITFHLILYKTLHRHVFETQIKHKTFKLLLKRSFVINFAFKRKNFFPSKSIQAYNESVATKQWDLIVFKH